MSGAAGPDPNDQLTLLANGQRLTGWSAVRVTRGVERMESSFDIALTEKFPGRPSGGPAAAGYQSNPAAGLYAGPNGQIVVKPGDPCQIMIGSDVVLTGYVDRYEPAFSAHEHGVRILGRGKVEDLADCSAVVPGALITTGSLLDMAQQLAQPYGVAVRSLTGDSVPLSVPGGGPVQFSVTLGETPLEIIERVARYATVLAYEETDGALVLARVGTATMASGFVQGVNVQGARAMFSLDQRYSHYLPAIMSADTIHDFGAGGATPFPPVPDQGVPRFRQLIVVSEQWQYGVSIAQARAQWEMTRRMGRSQMVRLTCDSWRDKSGNLWRPNALAPVHLPALKISRQSWVIAEVTFARDLERGTTADLLLMPKEGLALAPSVLQLYYWDVGQAVEGGAGAPNAGAANAPPPSPAVSGGAR